MAGQLLQMRGKRRRPSGPPTSMPATEPSGFTRIYSEDFDEAYPVGSFTAEDVGGIGTIVTTSPAYTRYRTKISVYPDDNWDTGHYAKYWATKVISTRTDVPDSYGVLDFYLHSETISGTVTALSAWIRPITVNDVGQKLLYGRFSMRMRADNTAIGYGAVQLLIADPWPDNGEQDWPEGAVSGGVEGYYHYAAPAGTNPFQVHVTAPGFYWNDWHIYTIEWTAGPPRRAKWFVDGNVVLDTTDRVGSTRNQYVLQSGGNGSVPPPTASGHLQVDWITVASSP